MMKLDIRQESTRHAEVVDAITRYLGVGSYMEWDEVGCLKIDPSPMLLLSDLTHALSFFDNG